MILPRPSFPLLWAVISCHHLADAFAPSSIGRAKMSLSAGLPTDTFNSAASLLVSSEENSIMGAWNNFQNNHTFLEGLLLTIVIKLVIGEIRKRVEKPIMDEAGRRVGENRRRAYARTRACRRVCQRHASTLPYSRHGKAPHWRR